MTRINFKEIKNILRNLDKNDLTIAQIKKTMDGQTIFSDNNIEKMISSANHNILRNSIYTYIAPININQFKISISDNIYDNSGNILNPIDLLNTNDDFNKLSNDDKYTLFYELNQNGYDVVKQSNFNDNLYNLFNVKRSDYGSQSRLGDEAERGTWSDWGNRLFDRYFSYKYNEQYINYGPPTILKNYDNNAKDIISNIKKDFVSANYEKIDIYANDVSESIWLLKKNIDLLNDTFNNFNKEAYAEAINNDITNTEINRNYVSEYITTLILKNNECTLVEVLYKIIRKKQRDESLNPDIAKSIASIIRLSVFDRLHGNYDGIGKDKGIPFTIDDNKNITMIVDLNSQIVEDLLNLTK